MTEAGERPPPKPRAWFSEVAPIPGQATRGQRAALVVGLLVVAWLALQLFASVLAPFVAAAGIAYVLDPPTTRLTPPPAARATTPPTRPPPTQAANRSQGPAEGAGASPHHQYVGDLRAARSSRKRRAGWDRHPGTGHPVPGRTGCAGLPAGR